MRRFLSGTHALVDARHLLLLHGVIALVLVPVLHVGEIVNAWSVLSWSLIAWAIVACLAYVVVIWRRFVGRALEGYPGEIPTQGIVVTGSVSSRVVLDFDAGTAEKAYGTGSPLVRWLYRLCFQAPFPYTKNEDALHAAVHRRTVVGLLTRFWFGENLVAPLIELRRLDDGRFGLVSELVRGDVPRNVEAAKQLLSTLTRRFLEAGLPVWQVADYNPRAIGNLMERPDGRFVMIDLESNLVTPFLPPAAIIRSIRRGQYPSFDDIDVPRLRAYLEEHRAAIQDALGPADSEELFAATERLAECQARWFAAEPRILSRTLRFLFRLIDVPTWIRGVRRLAGQGTAMGEAFVEDGVETWVAEGHLTEAQGKDLRHALANPEVALVVANLGAHLAITVPLRFPFGSLTRFSWTLVSRLAAEWRALRRRASAATARRVHTIPVMLATLLPGVGSGAYLLATPLRESTVLEFVALDSVLRRLPFRIHARFHLVALLVWFATPKSPPIHWERPAGIRHGAAQRLRTLAVCPRWFWLMLLLNATVLAIGAAVYFIFDENAAFQERGVLPTIAAVQLVAASVLGIAVYRRFWAVAGLRDRQERAGIFLWGLSGVGMALFAADDYFTVHERIGGWVADRTDFAAPLTNNVDDLITLAYGVVGLLMLHVFRHEVMRVRASSTLYLIGVIGAATMLLVDAYGRGGIVALEYISQFLAVGVLFLAHAQRYREVRALAAGRRSGSERSARASFSRALARGASRGR